MVKICTSCDEEKPLEEFYKSKRGKQGRHARCKRCYSLSYDQNYYALNKLTVLERNKISHKKRLKWYTELKKDKPCVDCKQVFHPAAMQFDHLPGFEKVNHISAIWSRAKILEEIQKCDLVCANCHAVRTYERFSK